MERFVHISIPNTISNRHLRRVWLLGMQGRSRDRMVSRRMAPFVGYVQHRLQEMVPVLLAAATWGKSWAGQCVCFQSDNMAVVSVLCSGKAKDHTLLHLLRCLHFYSATLMFTYTAGKLNTAAEALSRNKLQLFLSTFLQADKSPTPIPQAPRNLVFRGLPTGHPWTGESSSRLP